MKDRPNREPSKSFRRQRRQQQTRSEGLLWSVLRAKQLCRLKFRREFSIEHWIVDFLCIAQMLIVEIDGGYHDATIENDLQRQSELERLGWKILRFTDKEVEQDAEAVGRAIAKVLALKFEFKSRAKTGSGMKSQRSPSPRCARPSQREGEEFGR